MSKLSKQEVNAIASKLHREIEEKIRLEKLRAIHEYIPSPEYTQVLSNLNRIEELTKEIKERRQELEVLGKEVNEILDNLTITYNYWRWWESSECYDSYLNKIIEKETHISKVPSIEELKDDIVIASIDSDFNVEDYLKSQLEKW